MSKLLTACLLLGLVFPAAADVQIKIRDLTGQSSTVSSNGKMVRIDAGKQYFLVDYRAGEFNMVDPARGQVMKSGLGKDGVAVTGSAGVEVGIKSAGGGQKVAGYQTKKYQFSANGQPCGTIYASSKLLKDPGVRSMSEAMRTMQEKARGMMAGFGGMMSPCQQASLQLADAIGSIGVPMKTLDENGKLLSEVLAVDTRKQLPQDYYQVPANLQVVNLDDKIADVQESTQQIMQNLPDMNQLMEQMQQGGEGMSEEMQQQMQQQMEQMQKMLEQLQQQ